MKKRRDEPNTQLKCIGMLFNQGCVGGGESKEKMEYASKMVFKIRGALKSIIKAMRKKKLTGREAANEGCITEIL